MKGCGERLRTTPRSIEPERRLSLRIAGSFSFVKKLALNHI